MEPYPSILLENAVKELSRLPGIGRRSALRLALYILKGNQKEAEGLGEAIIRLRNEIHYCAVCHNIADTEVCGICSSPRRDPATLCVVEDIRDVMAIEKTAQFTGLYHVLGGIISPIEGIGPAQLTISSLVERIKQNRVREVILALSATIEGDTTSFYIFKQLAGQEVSISVLARGVSIGDELEYADEATLGRSIVNRTPYEQTLRK